MILSLLHSGWRTLNPRSGCVVAVVVWLMAAITLSTAAAQSTQPAGRFEDQPVRVSREPDAPAAVQQTAPAQSIPSIRFEWQRVAVALGIVLALIILLRFIGKKFVAAHGASGAAKTIRVLGRATTGPRQQVVLLQIGKRIIVAADNAGQLATLCQITEADEVAALRGQLEESLAPPPKTAFTNWFRKASDDFEEAPAEQLAPAGAAAEDTSLESARGEIAGLMDRARALTRQMRKH